MLQQRPKVICDTAHNKEGLSIVMQQLQKEPYKRLHIVLGVVSDKDLETILPLFPKDASYYYCQPKIPRAMPVAELKRIALTFNLMGEVFQSVNQAYKTAIDSAGSKDIIYIGGSTFVVAEVL